MAATVPCKLRPSDAQSTADAIPPLPKPMPQSSEYEKWAKHCVAGKRIRTQCKAMHYQERSADPKLSVGDHVEPISTTGLAFQSVPDTGPYEGACELQ